MNSVFVLGEAERYDPTNERTIPIVTKPDTVEQDLLPSAIQILLNKRKHMKLGYLVMKNSAFSEIDNSWEVSKEKEDDFFKTTTLWREAPDSRKGRVSVEKFLGELLYTHIKKKWPSLKKDIFEMIRGIDKEIPQWALR